MTYRRVIPRDLFNEGNLLKCLRRLAILLGETPNHAAAFDENGHCGAPFNIEQYASSGALEVTNLPFLIGRRFYRLTRPLNSRGAWPLYCENDDDAWSVFDDAGNLTEEFRALIGA